MTAVIAGRGPPSGLLACWAAATAVPLVLALGFPLAALARATSLVTLSIFALVNLALFRLKGREPLPAGTRGVPRLVPLAGFLCSTGFIVLEVLRQLSAEEPG